MADHLKKLTGTKDLTLGLIRKNNIRNLNQLVDCLRNEPYEIKDKEILDALNSLVKDKELEIESFFFGFDGMLEVNLSDKGGLVF